jgi:hypothetical protein
MSTASPMWVGGNPWCWWLFQTCQLPTPSKFTRVAGDLTNVCDLASPRDLPRVAQTKMWVSGSGDGAHVHVGCWRLKGTLNLLHLPLVVAWWPGLASPGRNFTTRAYVPEQVVCACSCACACACVCPLWEQCGNNLGGVQVMVCVSPALCCRTALPPPPLTLIPTPFVAVWSVLRQQHQVAGLRGGVQRVSSSLGLTWLPVLGRPLLGWGVNVHV